jgi:hypothetical protein
MHHTNMRSSLPTTAHRRCTPRPRIHAAARIHPRCRCRCWRCRCRPLRPLRHWASEPGGRAWRPLAASAQGEHALQGRWSAWAHGRCVRESGGATVFVWLCVWRPRAARARGQHALQGRWDGDGCGGRHASSSVASCLPPALARRTRRVLPPPSTASRGDLRRHCLYYFTPGKCFRSQARALGCLSNSG